MGTTQLISTEDGRTLPLNEMKQQFSFAYMHMVASAAGCSFQVHETDYDGVDATIYSSTEYRKYYAPKIDFQVKCTARRDLLTSTTMRWQMEAEPFRRLTNAKSYNQRFLGVLLVPEDYLAWIDLDESRLLTNSCMYWAHASNLGKIGASQKSKMVHLPRRNVFDVAQLQSIMRAVGEGGTW